MNFEILFNIIGFILNTFLFTLTKVTFLYLLHLHGHESKETWIAAMTLVLAVPEVAALVKLFWCTSFLLYGKLSEWPTLPSFVSGVVCSIMESTSLIFFLMRIGPKLHPIILIPLLSSVICMQIVSLYFKQGMRILDHNIDSNAKSLKNLLCAAIGVICVILVVATSFVTGFSQILTISESLILSTSLLALSFTWCPGIATFTIRSRHDLVNGRKNASIVYTILKLVVFFVLAVVITYLNRQVNVEDSFYSLLQGFVNITSTKTIRDGLLLHLVAGLLSHASTYVSTRICLTRSGIYLPTIFATPLTIFFICYDNFYGTFHIVKLSALSGFTLASWFCLGIAGLLWLLPFLMLGMNHTPVPNSILKSSESNFLSFTYNNIFLEHHLHLNYKPEGIHTKHDKTSEMLTGVPKVSKIFICTTMYREAEFEMERLLRSLQRLSLSKKLSHVYMESHVILDNGCKGNDLGEFALQLLSLLQNQLNIARTEVYANRMPYGLQLQWILNGGIPFFLHLKDTEKVKPKKRWSQVLYMNYIMSFRVKKAYDWIEKKLKLCEMESKPFNARYCVDERKFYGVDALDNQTNIPTIKCDYASSMLSQYSDCTAYTSGDETSCWSDDSELSKSQYSSSNVYLHPNGLDVPKANGKLSASNHSAVNSAYVYGAEDSGIPWAPNTITDMVRNDVSIHINPKIEEKSINAISGHLIKDTKLNMDSPFLPSSEEFDSRTYILATDADMKFDDDAVLDLLNTCNGDFRLGAACGRTHPIGERNRPIVWFQMFEYAKDFWMIKSAQNIIGSVMCCPGCFSLYRVAAVYQLLSEYAKESLESSDVFIKDTGEDRWMCTLMMMRGWKLKYCTYAFNTTYCPSTVEEFLKQRRRWMLSDLANTFLVMKHLPRLVRHNACFTAMYIIYLVQLFLIVIISPGSTIIMITAGLDMVFGITFVVPSILVCVILLVYMSICMFAPSKIQTYITIILIFVFGTAISCVFIGGAVYIIKDIIRDIESDSLEFQEHYLLILLTSSVFYAAILHPHETWIIFLGLFYMFMFPAMHILLPVYSISNIVDQSWGTRDGNKASVPKLVCFPKIRKRRKKKKKIKKDKNSTSLNSSSHSFNLFDKHEDEVEYKFWKFLRDFIIGATVRTGAPKLEMAEKLRRLRVKAIFAFLICNSIWMIILGYLFTNVTTERSKFNLFASVSGSLYGISFVVQMIGMTVHRTQDTIERFIRKSNRQSKRPEWIITKDEKLDAVKNRNIN